MKTLKDSEGGISLDGCLGPFPHSWLRSAAQTGTPDA